MVMTVDLWYVFSGEEGVEGEERWGVCVWGGVSPGPTQGPACCHFQGLDTTPVSQGFPAPETSSEGLNEAEEFLSEGEKKL